MTDSEAREQFAKRFGGYSLTLNATGTFVSDETEVAFKLYEAGRLAGLEEAAKMCEAKRWQCGNDILSATSVAAAIREKGK